VVPPRSSQQDLTLIATRTDVIKAFFQERLGLAPSEEGRVYIHYLVPRDQEAQLIPCLKDLEAQAVSADGSRRAGCLVADAASVACPPQA
jgi:hypothetical protein